MRCSICGTIGLSLLLVLSGCGGSSGKTTAKTAPAGEKGAAGGHDHHDHDHGHGGPHGGHIIELGEEEYHVEWLDDEKTDKVTFYILDSTMKKDVPIEADHLEVDVLIAKEKSPTTYTVPAKDRSKGEKPVASVFEAVDKGLLVGITLGEGAKATLRVSINGKQYSALIELKEHDEHDHEHEKK